MSSSSSFQQVGAAGPSAKPGETPWSEVASMPSCVRSPPINISSAVTGTSLSSRLRSISELRSAGKITPNQRNILKDIILAEGNGDGIGEPQDPLNGNAEVKAKQQLATALEAYSEKGNAKPIHDLLSSHELTASTSQSSSSSYLSDSVMASTSRLMARMSPSCSGTQWALSSSKLEPYRQSKPYPGNSQLQVDRIPVELAPSGLVFDERMCVHRHEQDSSSCARAKSSCHPECPERIEAIFSALQGEDLVKHFERVPARFATIDEITLVHTKKHCTEIQKLANDVAYRESREDLLSEDSVYVCAGTEQAAKLSAGSVIELTERVVNGRNRNGLAIVRPPGHHAERQRPMGFCIFNNCAVAAAYARRHLGVERVLIVDWDVHHGNGIQKMFIDDPGVFYFSVHRYHHGTFYPHTKDAGPEEIGVGDGKGYNANVGWNASKMGDADYMAAWHRILMPVAHQYAPQLVIVAAGFDAALGDPIGKCRLSPHGYAHLLHQLLGLAGGKVVVALEGGYSLKTISRAATSCAKTLLGIPPPPLKGRDAFVPKASAIRAINKTIRALAPHWEALQTDPMHFKDPMFRATNLLGNNKDRRGLSPAPPSPRVARRAPLAVNLDTLAGKRIKVKQGGEGKGDDHSIKDIKYSTDEDAEPSEHEEVWEKAEILGRQRGSKNERTVRIKYDSGKRALLELSKETYGTKWLMYASVL